MSFLIETRKRGARYFIVILEAGGDFPDFEKSASCRVIFTIESSLAPSQSNLDTLKSSTRVGITLFCFRDL